MKKILSALLILAAVSYYAVSQAQTQTQTQAAPQTPPVSAAENKPLDERFSGCMGNKDCSTQVKLELIQEENDAMNVRFQKIHQACADANFQDCIDKQRNDVDAWYAALDDMQKLMQSTQTQGMNGKEPAAGGPAMPSAGDKWKAFWNKLWPSGNEK